MAVENFYGLEGLDGVGKTTVRETLRERGYVVLKTPPNSFPLKRESYDGFSTTPRFAFYLAGVIMAGNEAITLAKDKPVVCDRYLLTTIAAHEAMGLSPVYISLITPFLKHIPVPKDTFLLTADEQERMRRMLERGANKVDLANLKINDGILNGYRKWSQKLNHHLTEVDTTHMQPKQVVERIEDIVYSK